MKKLIYGTLFLALVGIGVVGCKKENKLPLVESNKSKISTDGKMLIFETVESYENSVEDLTEEKREKVLSEISKLNFKNYFSVEHFNSKSGNDSIQEMDDYLGQLLNEVGIVQIGNYIYKVNLQSEKVFVLAVSNSSEYQDLVNENVANKNIRKFSIDDDVIYIAESDEPGEKCGGSSDFDVSRDISDQSNGNFKFSARHFKAGIYNRIVIRGIHEYFGYSWPSQNYDSMKFEVHVDSYWQSLRARRRPCNGGSATYHQGGVRAFPLWSNTSSTAAKHFNVYEGTRALNGYRVWVRGEITINGTKYNTDYFGAITNSNF